MVSWCVNAKISLTDIHGFSPYQLAIGTKPKLTSTHHAKAPAHTNIPTIKIVAKNLEGIHKVREAFAASENSEKLKKGLVTQHQTNYRYQISNRGFFVL